MVLIMNLEDYPHINEQRKKMMLEWSDSELLIEINKGKDSLLPDSIPFMKAILEERKNKAAIETSGKAYRLSILAIIISIVAIVVSLNN